MSEPISSIEGGISILRDYSGIARAPPTCELNPKSDEVLAGSQIQSLIAKTRAVESHNNSPAAIADAQEEALNTLQLLHQIIERNGG